MHKRDFTLSHLSDYCRRWRFFTETETPAQINLTRFMYKRVDKSLEKAENVSIGKPITQSPIA